MMKLVVVVMAVEMVVVVNEIYQLVLGGGLPA